MRRAAIVASLAAAFTLLLASPASAHPLGNFSVNQSSAIVVAPDRVTVTYVLDLAEIPTVEHRITDPSGECAAAATDASLTVAGATASLRVVDTALTFPKGQAGLETTRLTCRFAAPVAVSGPVAVDYRIDRYPDRVGWREITAAGDGTTLVADVPSASVTDQLRHYPRAMVGHPLDERATTIEARPGGARLASTHHASPTKPEARGVDGLTASFTRLVGRHDLGFGIGALAIVLATLLGAIHAFAPGHGKTVMAAYLVGRHGSLKQASVVALTVTATHTTGVLLLGVLVSSSALVAPERLYPWLGAASGAMLVAIGAVMLRAAQARRARAAAHARAHEHGHHHDHDHGHSHGGRWHTHEPPARMDRTGLLAMGFVGGLLPSPSALVVLLGAIALGRAWFGVVLVVAYGAGMALTLTGVGLLLVRGRDTLSRRLPRLVALEPVLPAITGTVVLVVGTFLAYRGIAAI